MNSKKEIKLNASIITRLVEQDFEYSDAIGKAIHDLTDAMRNEFNRKNTYTPGPWVNDGGVICDDRGNKVATVRAFVACGNEDENAELIAAAPEMLDVLVEIDGYFDRLEERYGGLHLDAMRMSTLVDEVIKKAMGES